MENDSQTKLAWYEAGCPVLKEITLGPEAIRTPKQMTKMVLSILTKERKPNGRYNNVRGTNVPT